MKGKQKQQRERERKKEREGQGGREEERRETQTQLLRKEQIKNTVLSTHKTDVFSFQNEEETAMQSLLEKQN